MRYLFIFEDGVLYRGDIVTQDDMGAADDGIVDIVDTVTMKNYYNNEWFDIEEWRSGGENI